MQRKFCKAIGFLALGLMFFVCTLIIIKWTIDFVTWSTLDSGWAQAIGSVAALGVAIYIMRKQTTFAIETENRALKRQAETVAAVVAKLNDEIQHYADRLSDIEGAAAALFDLKDANAFFETSKAVDSIPLYSLGSVKMVRGIFEMQKAARRFKELLQLGKELHQAEPDFHKWDREEIARRADFMGLVSKIAYGIFLDGYNKLLQELKDHKL